MTPSPLALSLAPEKRELSHAPCAYFARGRLNRSTTQMHSLTSRLSLTLNINLGWGSSVVSGSGFPHSYVIWGGRQVGIARELVSHSQQPKSSDITRGVRNARGCSSGTITWNSQRRRSSAFHAYSYFYLFLYII